MIMIVDWNYINVKIKEKIWWVLNYGDVIMCVIITSFADNDTWEEIQEFIEEN